jgi:hypothetical protein
MQSPAKFAALKIFWILEKRQSMIPKSGDRFSDKDHAQENQSHAAALGST